MNQIDPQIQNLGKNLVLRLEVIVDTASPDSGVICNLPERGRRITLSPEVASCCFQYLIPSQLRG